jgi:hypothetical protein
MFFVVIPLKNSKLKFLYPWRIPTSKPFTPEEFQLKFLYPWRIPSSKSFTPEEFQPQNPLPLKNSNLKILYPWRIPTWKPFTPDEFQLKILYPWRIPPSKPFTPEEFQAQNPLPLKNSKLNTLYPWRIPYNDLIIVYPQSSSSTAIDYKVKFIYMLSKKYKLKELCIYLQLLSTYYGLSTTYLDNKYVLMPLQ